MKSKLGYIRHFPKDYTKEKYIVFPELIRFSEHFKRRGTLPGVLLDSQISLEEHDIDFLPFKVNIFNREKFERHIVYAEDIETKNTHIEFLKKIIRRRR
jgi:hypothetical protein